MENEVGCQSENYATRVWPPCMTQLSLLLRRLKFQLFMLSPIHKKPQYKPKKHGYASLKKITPVIPSNENKNK